MLLTLMQLRLGLSNEHILDMSGMLNSGLTCWNIMMNSWQIKEELMLQFYSLGMSPGAKIKGQWTMSDCSKRIDIANLRIYMLNVQ